MRTIDSDFLAKLNSKHSGGVFVHAVRFTESTGPLVERFFVSHDRSIIFDGNTYDPLPMTFSGMDSSGSMKLPVIRIAIPNVNNIVIDYIEDLDILENDVTIMLLHLDLLGNVNAKDKSLFQLQVIESDDVTAVFSIGMNIGLDDAVPKEVMLKEEFPGILDTVFTGI